MQGNDVNISMRCVVNHMKAHVTAMKNTQKYRQPAQLSQTATHTTQAAALSLLSQLLSTPAMSLFTVQA